MFFFRFCIKPMITNFQNFVKKNEKFGIKIFSFHKIFNICYQRLNKEHDKFVVKN